MPVLLKRTFKAWLDHASRSKPKLIVTGELEVPTSAWEALMLLKQPQGLNPKILLLEVHAQAPTGHVSQIAQKIPLRYEQPASPDAYKQVTILYDSDSVTVDVKPVN
jgi:hypothetical protein